MKKLIEYTSTTGHRCSLLGSNVEAVWEKSRSFEPGVIVDDARYTCIALSDQRTVEALESYETILARWQACLGESKEKDLDEVFNKGYEKGYNDRNKAAIQDEKRKKFEEKMQHNQIMVDAAYKDGYKAGYEVGKLKGTEELLDRLSKHI